MEFTSGEYAGQFILWIFPSCHMFSTFCVQCGVVLLFWNMKYSPNSLRKCSMIGSIIISAYGTCHCSLNKNKSGMTTIHYTLPNHHWSTLIQETTSLVKVNSSYLPGPLQSFSADYHSVGQIVTCSKKGRCTIVVKPKLYSLENIDDMLL